MSATGVQPDNHLWATYISGLLHCRDWKSCLRVLEEMSLCWKVASDTRAKRTVNLKINVMSPGYLPSINPINAAVSGLIDLKKNDIAQNVFKWAVAQKLKPDTRTYNILLRSAVRQDREEDTKHILHDMETAGSLPDIVTFTILLDGLFRNETSLFKYSENDEQDVAVARIFTEMEAIGMEANAHTYGTILDGLLVAKHQNINAARAVLHHMRHRKYKPSPHIYTVLATYYFSTTPPNLAAIEDLMQRIRMEGTHVDHVFYDRMIEGYSRVGELDKMLKMLRQMPTTGKVPGWIALLCALRALEHAEEWDLVKNLIRDVVDEEGLFRHGTRGWRGQGEFWELVENLRARGIQVPVRDEPH